MRKKRLFANRSPLPIILMLSICASGYSQTYCVRMCGDDCNAGPRERVFGSIEKATELARPGEIISIRGGTYTLSDTITIKKHDLKGKLINLWAYPGEEPILDFSNGSASSNGLKIKGMFWHIKGLIIQKAGQKGIHVNGSNNVIENPTTRNN